MALDDLEELYLDRLLAIRQHTPDNAKAKAAMLGVLDEIDGEILFARASGDSLAVAEYTALREYVKDVI